MAIFIGRLFYLQIIRHDYYRSVALESQLKEYVIPAERGQIRAYDNGVAVPLVLNQKLYTLFADPLLVKNASKTAKQLADIMHADASGYERAMKTSGTRYVVLAKKVPEAQKAKIMALKLPGIGTQAQDYRIYPQGALAAQLLGFVNEDGDGKYGIEQALDETLAGKPGKLKAVTDASGVPLPASPGNIQISPRDGRDAVLTINLSMQKQLEDILQRGLQRAKSASGGAIIMNPSSGAILAMANYPSYSPAEYFNVTDQKLFNNASVADPLEVGSTMKPLTAAAAIDLGAIKAAQTYSDPGRWSLDGHAITNVEEIRGAGTRSVGDILDYSINTGATWMLMQMGGQTGVVNRQARERWHDYMVNHFQLGKPTGIEQGYEAKGFIPDPLNGDARQLAYANTSFGQAMTATPLQMGAALSSVINGGTYYQPHLVDKILNPDGTATSKRPKVMRKEVVSASTAQEIRSLLVNAIKQQRARGNQFVNYPDNYEVGGKTGTAQIANPAGGYYENRFNGMYYGFVGGAKPQYVIVVRANEPKIGGYAGSAAAKPIFHETVHMLINNFNVTPR